MKSVVIKTLSPGGYLSLPGAIHMYMYKIMKNLYKIKFQRDFFFVKLATSDQSDKMFLLT